MKFLCLINSLIFFNSLLGFSIDKLNSKQSPYKTKVLSQKEIHQFFSPAQDVLPHTVVVTNIDDLYDVAKDTLFALETYKKKGWISNVLGLSSVIGEENSINTLKFIIKIIDLDKKKGFGFRLKNPHFLQKCFKFLSWTPDHQTAKEHRVKMGGNNDIRLTHYVVFKALAMKKKVGEYSCALYKLLDTSIAKKYAKQEVISGALEHSENHNKVKPLAWVTREALEDALLQGTILLVFPDGSQQLFSVHIDNGIPYDKKQKDKKMQKRYWYFRRVEDDQIFIKKLEKRKHVVVAGDISSLGLGRLIILDYMNKQKNRREIRLCILADTGGAFVKNAYQLDVFAGVFPSQKLVNLYVSKQPMFAQAHIAYR